MKDTLSTIFKFQNRFVMLGWIALVALPYWHYMPVLVMTIVLFISASYAYLILFGKRLDDEGAKQPNFKSFSSLSGVLKLFQNRRVTLAGWLHYCQQRLKTEPLHQLKSEPLYFISLG